MKNAWFLCELLSYEVPVYTLTTKSSYLHKQSNLWSHKLPKLSINLLRPWKKIVMFPLTGPKKVRSCDLWVLFFYILNVIWGPQYFVLCVCIFFVYCIVLAQSGFLLGIKGHPMSTVTHMINMLIKCETNFLSTCTAKLSLSWKKLALSWILQCGSQKAGSTFVAKGPEWNPLLFAHPSTLNIKQKAHRLCCSITYVFATRWH